MMFIPDQGLMGAHYLVAASTMLALTAEMVSNMKAKPTLVPSKHAEPVNSCTECHDPHSLHTQKVPNSDANLCSTCHSDVKSYQDYKKISMSKVDYDGDGTAESTYEEIEGMRALLIKALAGYSTAKSGATFGFNREAYPYALFDTNADGTLSEEESAFPNQFKGLHSPHAQSRLQPDVSSPGSSCLCAQCDYACAAPVRLH